MSENYASNSNTLNTSKSDDEELDLLRKEALKTISAAKQHHQQQSHQHPPTRPHNMENNPYNNNYPGDYRRHHNYHPHNPHPPQHHSIPPRLPPQQHMLPHIHPPPQQQPFYNPPQMQPRYYAPTIPQQYGMPTHQQMPMGGNALWDREFPSPLFSPGASLVPTNVQLSPRSQAFVAENNDILLKRKGDRFLRRSRSKSWSRSPSPHGRSSTSYKNGRRFSPRKRSLSNSSGESPSGRKYSRKVPKQQTSPKNHEDQKKETAQPVKRRGGSPISFNDGKKDNHKEPAPQKITLNRNRIIQLNSSKTNSSNPRPVWNRNSNSNNRNTNTPSSNVSSKTKEEEKKDEKKDESQPKRKEEKPTQPVETKQSENPPPETKKPPPVKPQRVKTAEELYEEELLRSDDECDEAIVLTNDDLNIDDLFNSDSESENEGRFKSKPTNSKDSPLSFSKLGEKPVTKIRPLDDVIDKSGNRNRGYDKGSKVGNNFSRKSAPIEKEKKSEKKPLEFRKLSLDRKKSYDKEQPPRKVIIGRSNLSSNIVGDTKSGLEKKSIYSRLGGKTSDGLDNKREKV